MPAITRGLYYYALKNENRELTLGTLIENNARNLGSRPAILFDDRSITWSELNGWANRIARYLQDQGLTKGDAIAIFLENRPELLAVVAGAAKLGVACAMLNTSQRGKVLEHSINLIEPKMVVVGEELIEAFEGVKTDLKTAHPQPFQFLTDTNTLNAFGDAPTGYANMAAQVSTFNSDAPVLSDAPKMGDTAIYLFTSGTTGLPKAAPGSHRKFIMAYGGFGLMSLAMKPEDVITAPLCWSAGGPSWPAAPPLPCAASSPPAPSGTTFAITTPPPSATSANSAATC